MRSMVLKSILADQPVWSGANSSAEGDGEKACWLDGIEDTKKTSLGDIFP